MENNLVFGKGLGSEIMAELYVGVVGFGFGILFGQAVYGLASRFGNLKKF